MIVKCQLVIGLRLDLQVITYYYFSSGTLELEGFG